MVLLGKVLNIVEVTEERDFGMGGIGVFVDSVRSTRHNFFL